MCNQDNYFEGKRILITGATGLIGSHLVRALVEEKATVIALGRRLNKLEKVFEDIIDVNNLFLLEGNVTCLLPEEVKKIDFVFHAASPISGNEIKQYPCDVISANLKGTINCLEFLKKQGYGRLVVFSSVVVYGNLYDNNGKYSESETHYTDALHTDNTPYSESKRMIEVISRAYHRQYGVDSVIARLGYVYGYSKIHPQTAFYEFIDKAIEGENLVFYNSGMPRRDNIYISDAVSGLLLLARKGETAEAYNLSAGGEKNNYKAIDEIACVIADTVNKIFSNYSIKVIVEKNKKARGNGVLLDNSKLKRLGWDVKNSLEEGVKQTIVDTLGL